MSAAGKLRERKERIKETVQESLRPLTLPNFITLLRLAMVPFFVLAVNEGEFRLAFLVFVLAGLTDAMDGILARTFDLRSRFGAYLDPIADKLLLVTAYVTLTIPQGQAVVIPLWLTILALSRDVLIVVVALVLYLTEDVRTFRPTVWGKATTFVHVVTVGVVLLANFTSIPGWAAPTCFTAAVVLVVVSGLHYIYRAARWLESRSTAAP